MGGGEQGWEEGAADVAEKLRQVTEKQPESNRKRRRLASKIRRVPPLPRL